MKKIAFGLQVVALLLALPLYVVVEMNHSTVAPTRINHVNRVTENEKNIYQPPIF